jgi:hypothetical protein
MKRWKIFAGLAAALALAVVAAETHGTSPLDLYLHDTYFVVPTPQVGLIFGVLSAAVCFGALRLTPHRPNHLLGLGGFALVAFSCSVLLVLSAFRNWQDSQQINWQVYVLAVAGSSFVLGFVVLSASLVWTLAWTLVRIARTHDKTRLGG